MAPWCWCFLDGFFVVEFADVELLLPLGEWSEVEDALWVAGVLCMDTRIEPPVECLLPLA